VQGATGQVVDAVVGQIRESRKRPAVSGGKRPARGEVRLMLGARFLAHGTLDVVASGGQPPVGFGALGGDPPRRVLFGGPHEALKTCLERKQVLQLFFGRLAEAASHEGTTSPHASLMPGHRVAEDSENRLKNRLLRRSTAKKFAARRNSGDGGFHRSRRDAHGT
jgi:hypothetical protein